MAELRRLEIEPSDNGGHTVTHHFKSAPVKRPGGNIAMDYPDSKQHVFGPGDGGAVMAHIGKALGLKGPKVETEE